MPAPTGTLLIHRGFEHVEGANAPAGQPEHVRISIEPHLERRGECRYEPFGYTIALREWDPSVFLHEWLHILLDQHIPHDGPGGFNHKVINTIEVGLQPILHLLRSDDGD